MLQNTLNDERNYRLNSGSNVKSKEKRSRERERRIEERIQNLQEKAWDQRKIQKEKERGSTIYQREWEREKQELSKRGSFKLIVSTLSQRSFKAFKRSSINNQPLLKHSSVHLLWENPKKRFIIWVKFLLLYLLI